MALAELTPDPGADYGEVFTRRWVVELILDLVGYTPDRDLGRQVLVEPSCGTGAFLVPVAERLIESAVTHGHDLRSLGPAIRAFDLLEANAQRARKAAAQLLVDHGLDADDAEAMAGEWVTTDDFLLHGHESAFADYVVGNPPYIRLENVSRRTMDAYRRICPTMRGRADIYVGFIERGLDLLKPDGSLSFICADRWMRNQYGSDLRELVSANYAVDAVIAMHDVDAFEDDVSAYPAIVVLRNGAQGKAVVVEANAEFDEDDVPRFTAWAKRGRRRIVAEPAYEATRVDRWFTGGDLWPAGSPSQLALLADLESRFAPLQDPDTGTRVGIGVATGCDEIFITDDGDLVETDRLLPLLQAHDLTEGSARWSGRYLVNPWNGSGLVDLDRYPKLRAYLDDNQRRLRGRHIARQRPATWYRTIDRVHQDLTARPKLLIPDIKAAAHPVLDEGGHYPHHNLYYVVSDTWDLEVLGGLLLSDVANLFVGAYCVKMRGGTYRFQAQYLRRIRVPDPRTISRGDARSLARAFRDRDRVRATGVAADVYGLPAILG
ncbi:MAG: N-6 DNA methylase [Acidimicrobiales bacterium]|nr:N-6 DNA methylase [Acidimicrobiales bacterium]MCB9376936.1 N-6 DNA methylase [Microthrixaceae bacterium]MCB9399968.1 N-6 DNA methylase [Microthrixaceae bacterium]